MLIETPDARGLPILHNSSGLLQSFAIGKPDLNRGGIRGLPTGIDRPQRKVHCEGGLGQTGFDIGLTIGIGVRLTEHALAGVKHTAAPLEIAVLTDIMLRSQTPGIAPN